MSEMRLKANKTSLYKLVAKYEQLPGMKYTDFLKVSRHMAYFLDWRENGEVCRAFLSPCMGELLLVVETPSGRRVYRPTIQDLQECRMIDSGNTERSV